MQQQKVLRSSTSTRIPGKLQQCSSTFIMHCLVLLYVVCISYCRVGRVRNNNVTLIICIYCCLYQKSKCFVAPAGTTPPYSALCTGRMSTRTYFCCTAAAAVVSSDLIGTTAQVDERTQACPRGAGGGYGICNMRYVRSGIRYTRVLVQQYMSI